MASQHASQVIASIQQVSDGVVHLGDDGVLRSFDGNMKVLDYVPFSPAQIQQAINRSTGKTLEHLQEVYNGIDGQAVTDLNQLQNPGPELLPRAGEGYDFEDDVKELARRTEAPDVQLFKKAELRCPDGIRCSTNAQCAGLFFCASCFQADRIAIGRCQ